MASPAAKPISPTPTTGVNVNLPNALPSPQAVDEKACSSPLVGAGGASIVRVEMGCSSFLVRDGIFTIVVLLLLMYEGGGGQSI